MSTKFCHCNVRVHMMIRLLVCLINNFSSSFFFIFFQYPWCKSCKQWNLPRNFLGWRTNFLENILFLFTFSCFKTEIEVPSFNRNSSAMQRMGQFTKYIQWWWKKEGYYWAIAQVLALTSWFLGMWGKKKKKIYSLKLVPVGCSKFWGLQMHF